MKKLKISNVISWVFGAFALLPLVLILFDAFRNGFSVFSASTDYEGFFSSFVSSFGDVSFIKAFFDEINDAFFSGSAPWLAVAIEDYSAYLWFVLLFEIGFRLISFFFVWIRKMLNRLEA